MTSPHSEEQAQVRDWSNQGIRRSIAETVCLTAVIDQCDAPAAELLKVAVDLAQDVPKLKTIGTTVKTKHSSIFNSTAFIYNRTSRALSLLARSFRWLKSACSKSGAPPSLYVISAVRKRQFIAAALFFIAGLLARAQAPQFLPEVDTYFKINPVFRAYFQAKADRDEGAPVQATLGPSLQVYFKPLVRLKKITAFDLDDAHQRPLVVEAGYRYVTAPNEPVDNRFMPVATVRFPMKGSVLITDRNRADLDWKGGTFQWRYRNKLTLQRTFAVRSYHLTPSISAEPYYTSQYEKWSTTDLYAACVLPAGKHVQFEPYYEHENNTGKSPNQQVNNIGLIVDLFFSPPKK